MGATAVETSLDVGHREVREDIGQMLGEASLGAVGTEEAQTDEGIAQVGPLPSGIGACIRVTGDRFMSPFIRVGLSLGPSLSVFVADALMHPYPAASVMMLVAFLCLIVENCWSCSPRLSLLSLAITGHHSCIFCA